MALKPLRPCRHPGCRELTRDGYCPKHKPKRAARRASAEWHGWYSLSIWTDNLRPAQLLREPWCRECARRGVRTRATVVDHVRPHKETGSCSSTRPTTRACASVATTARPPGRWRRSAGKTAKTEGLPEREATSAPVDARRRAGAHGRSRPGQAEGLRIRPDPKKVSGAMTEDRAASRLREIVPHQGFGPVGQEVRSMPTPPKALDNMNKNLTDEERQLREQAEQGVIPDRGRESRMERPALMTKNAAAGRYWKKVLERMDGLVILDDLDSDALGVYCVMLARYETQCKVLAQAIRKLKDAKDDPEAVADAVSKLDAVSGKMQSLERNILQYAEKLGLTPSGRVRLAQKRAQAAAEDRADPDGDLFGD